MSLSGLIARTIGERLSRKTITTCSLWAEKYREMGPPFPGTWTFDHHPWLLEMHDAEDDIIVGQKAAQMGYTEWAMNMSFYYIDIHGLSVLYVLPTRDDASQFSSGRFDPALTLSSHIAALFSDVNNVKMKVAGHSILYIRGSKSRSQLNSIPTPIIVFDEQDEMPPENVKLGEERQSGQVVTKQLRLSTPTIPGFGINKEFEASTQDYYHFKCPSCSKLIVLKYPESLVITGDDPLDPNVANSYYICHLCKARLENDDKPNLLKSAFRGGTGRFVSTHLQRPTRGFHVSQMYSMANAGKPASIALAALKAERDETEATEFHNSKLGITYVAKGAKVTDEMLDATIGTYRQKEIQPIFLRTMGIDVGSVLHIIVTEWKIHDTEHLGISVNDRATGRIVLTEETDPGDVHDFDRAHEMFMDMKCHAGVIDAEPERRAAYSFATKLWGYVLLCDYLWSQQGRQVQIAPEEEALLKVNRTAWLDMSIGRFKNGTIETPQDPHRNFRDQIKEPVRVLREDKWGNPYAVYVNEGPDHFAHALNYAEIALPLGFGLSQNLDIVDMY